MAYTNTSPDGSSCEVTNDDNAMMQMHECIPSLAPSARNQQPITTDHAFSASPLHPQGSYLERVEHLCASTEKYSYLLAVNGYHHHPLFMHSQGHGDIEQSQLNGRFPCQQGYYITTDGILFSPPLSASPALSSHFDIINNPTTTTTSTYHENCEQPDPLVIPDASTSSNLVSLSSSIGMKKSRSDLLNTCYNEAPDQQDCGGGANNRKEDYLLLTPPSATDTPHPLRHLSSSYDLAATSSSTTTTTSGNNQHEQQPLFCQQVSGGFACTTTSTSNSQCNKRSSGSVAKSNSLETQRPYACGICDGTFKRPQDLNRHLRSVHGPRIHICLACQRTFSRKDSLNRHQESACKGRAKQHRHQKTGHRLSGNNNIHVNVPELRRLEYMKFRTLWSYSLELQDPVVWPFFASLAYPLSFLLHHSHHYHYC